MPFNYNTLQYGVYPPLKEFFRACDFADHENLNSRDVTFLFKILGRPLKVNRRLRGIVNTRKTALRCFTWSLVGREASDYDVTKIKPRVYDGIETILKNQLDTELYGRILFPLTVVNNDLGNVVKVGDVEEPYEYDVEDDIFYHICNGQKTPFKPEERVLFDSTEDAIGGLMRIIMVDEILRYDMTLEYGNFLRKLKGILQIINKGGSKEDESAAENAARNVIRENYVITGENIDFKLNDVVSNSGTAFKDFLEMKQREETIAILGQANTTELPANGGSRAALQVQKLISSDIFYSDMIRVESLVNRYLLLDYQMNFSPNATIADMPYLFRLNIEEEEDIEKNAIAIREILATGIDLIKNEVYQKIRFTVPGDGDVIIKGIEVQPKPVSVPGT